MLTKKYCKNKRLYAKPFIPRLAFMATVLSSMFSSTHAQIVVNGTTETLTGPTAIDTGILTGPVGNAISVSNSGKLTAFERIDLTTGGSGAFGIYVEGAGSIVDLQKGGSITINDSGSAIFSSNGASVTSNGPLSITSKNIAVYAQSGGQVSINQGEIVTSGDNSAGVGINDNVGGYISIKNTNITATGASSRAVWAAGSNSVIEVDNAIIITTGAYDSSYSWGPRGISAENGATITLSNSTVSTLGQFGFGIFATNGSNVESNNVSIQTQGSSAHGLWSYAGSSIITAHNTAVVTSGLNSAGA